MANAVAYVRGIIPDKANREKDDFYPTPPAAVRALLSVETFEGAIWEPACGDGAIAGALLAACSGVAVVHLFLWLWLCLGLLIVRAMEGWYPAPWVLGALAGLVWGVWFLHRSEPRLFAVLLRGRRRHG